MSRRSGTCLRLCLVIFAIVSALGVCGPAIYWKFKKDMKLEGYSKSKSCPPCICDCPPPLSLLKISPVVWEYQGVISGMGFEHCGPRLANLSVSDCRSSDPELKEETQKQFVDLLAEELKLQEAVSKEHS
ncbi:hypothetical protein MLD38_005655 [Melastoma candidum]|uniref:Uncharacterized protein n=1 Tax=Melastoma candidum TaxID=119954 RepID=A0ACB9RNE5_9MYRT|nr:hypothetical protein MLD38_005655 [Melastoma candidum]